MSLKAVDFSKLCPSLATATMTSFHELCLVADNALWSFSETAKPQASTKEG